MSLIQLLEKHNLMSCCGGKFNDVKPEMGLMACA